MSWTVEFLKEAENDLSKLDGSVRKQVLKGIIKVCQNPLPADQGGYGKPLGNRSGNDLSGLLKIKFKKIGIRVVYKNQLVDNVMRVIIISARSDNQVYNEALARRKKHAL